MSTNAHVLQEFGSIPEHHHHCDDIDDHCDHGDGDHDGDSVDANVFCNNSGALLDKRFRKYICQNSCEKISKQLL